MPTAAAATAASARSAACFELDDHKRLTNSREHCPPITRLRECLEHYVHHAPHMKRNTLFVQVLALSSAFPFLIA